MARPHRTQVAGLLYHVTATGNRHEPIYADDFDRQRFLGFLALVVRKFRWTCHAYCLMTTHYHLMITTREPNIGRGMHFLNGRYAQSFNRRHKLSGHVFQDRYHSVIVAEESHLLELVRYIALNPVRAGVCSTPENWDWSSYACTLGVRKAPEFLSDDFVLSCFGSKREQALRRLHAFVDPETPAWAAAG
jgi:REP-associated tyrosine transposase